MKAFTKVDMAEVTRLTRAGRLHDAMALLQGRLDGDAHASNAASPISARDARATLDMVPPSPATGGAWTAAAFPDDRGD